MTDIDISSLIAGCRANNRQSQQQLHKHFYAYGVKVCTRYLSNEADIRAVLNEAFYKVFTKIEQHTPEQSFKAWFSRIVTNAAIDYLKKYKFNQSHNELSSAETIETSSEVFNDMSEKEILGIVKLLPPMYRTVFTLYAVEGFQHNEISEMLNITVGTSKSNFSRAKVKLKELLELHNIERYGK